MSDVFDRPGDSDTFFVCEECGRSGIAYYRTKRPRYCSNACKQKAYRRRAAAAQNVTDFDLASVTNRGQREIERALDMSLHLMRCSCGRGIWTTRGNVQIGGLRCDRCNTEFRAVR